MQRSSREGRACPRDYRLPQQLFSADPLLRCETLYVAGGLYGNPFALTALDRLVGGEAEDCLVLLNGDMHWFDRSLEDFQDIERRTASYVRLAGNVERELCRRQDVGVGCGCAYPSCVSDAAVGRSNSIHALLKETFLEDKLLRERMEGRPAAAVVDVAGRKVGVTHGDEKLVGGWQCSREALRDMRRQEELGSWMERNRIDVFASSHTCAPAALRLAKGAVINNGAAGLPNFRSQKYGLAIRISTIPAREALFGAECEGLFVDAVPLRYDHKAFLKWFDALWPTASPAATSYRDRIANGPDDDIGNALLGGFSQRRALSEPLF